MLLHHEQFKIPENLARFAVKAGMGGFVKKMGPAVVNFVANRRQRVDPVRPTELRSVPAICSIFLELAVPPDLPSSIEAFAATYPSSCVHNRSTREQCLLRLSI